ncbi:signal peptide protein [Caballeronia calidae]|uniref:Signal peptide protein n=1 Tax=Caballeronia calidae TaxID=1777139 RepID=A0A157Z3E1_9BURK|nr:hypothetical protein [Caballeronia calidae]SAK39953.1 signal peptide protein [Caballeronia calidae]
MKKKLAGRILASVLAVAALGATSIARADVHVGVNVGIPAPVYVAPTPVYAPPPPPVIYQPAPVYAVPVVIGWHGDRYWDGRRYWNRNDWYRHHGHGHGHGNGHGKGHGNGHGHH